MRTIDRSSVFNPDLLLIYRKSGADALRLARFGSVRTQSFSDELSPSAPYLFTFPVGAASAANSLRG